MQTRNSPIFVYTSDKPDQSSHAVFAGTFGPVPTENSVLVVNVGLTIVPSLGDAVHSFRTNHAGVTGMSLLLGGSVRINAFCVMGKHYTQT